MKILFIAPLPPPINGHSLVCKIFYDSLISDHHVIVADLRKEGLQDGVVGIKRIKEILSVFWTIFQRKKDCNISYLTISESFAGNLKDIIIYLLTYSLLSKTYIHLHGGSIKRLLFDKYPFLHSINQFFIKKMAGVIISGKSHLEIFETFIPKNKIHIVPNFAKEELFIEESMCEEKFQNMKPIRLLFLSNMIPLKGYLILLEAFLSLEKSISQKYILEFAGRFDTEEERLEFESKIQDQSNIKYHGLVSDEKKYQLFRNAHVFILPTMFFEGQPVSILEAFAAGTVVVTTGQSGILDVFEKSQNGFLVESGSVESLKNVLIHLQKLKGEEFKSIAMQNLKKALERYRVKIYTNNLQKAIGLK